MNVTMRQIAAWLPVLLVALPGQAWADSEPRAAIDSVTYDAKENLLTLSVDILDAKNVPIDGVGPGDLELTASGKPLKLLDVQIQTADKAQEPVAVVLLLNASRAYMLQGEGEVNSSWVQEKEGAAQFIQRLSGNDKIAVLRYREGFPYEKIYEFASNFTQAKEAVASDQVPAQDENPEGIQGKELAQKTLAPESVRAIDRALNYIVENLDKLGSVKRRFVVVMSDGKNRETNKGKLESKIQSMLEKYEEYHVRVHAIGFTADDPQYLSLLQTIANGTGGAYVKVETKDLGQIPSVWDNLAVRIKKQYIVTAKLAEMPDGGEPLKGKDEANHVLALKVKLRGGALAEGSYDNVRLPKPTWNWVNILKYIGMGLGALLGVGLLVWLVMAMARRRGQVQPQSERRQQYDGPSRGKLMVLQGPLAGDAFPLVDDVTTIGSMKGNSIVIQDGSVSRRHAAIKIDQMRYEVADMNSTNGILVNGQRVHKIFLKDGDRIQIGTTELQFNLK